jgi:HEAT repeat protein
MLAYQLRHDDDVTGRLEAADLLGERGGDVTALAALASATTDDPFWAVRRAAARGLTTFGGDTTAQLALLTATRDSDARVRTRVAHVLAAFPGANTEDRLRDLTADSSRYVRGAALIALATLDTSAALPLIQAAMTHPSWNDIERKGAVQALAVFRTPPPQPAKPTTP